jgi:peptidoglycan/LPS O-acetylase OafA/YrhL
VNINPKEQRLDYLDAIRGIAILCVLLQHNFNLNLPVGNIGVLFFFGLSGYLILGVKNKEENRNSIADFLLIAT